MIPEQVTKLENYESDYLNLGITEDGKPRCIYPCYWSLSRHTYNMQLPDIYICPDDLKDERLMGKLNSFHIKGCYIFTPLERYDFIADFKEVRDISIANNPNMKNLSFLKKLSEWIMLSLHNVNLDNLDDIRLSLDKSERSMDAGLSISNCEIKDISALYGSWGIYELVVIGGDPKTERERWRELNASYKHFYELNE